METIGETLYRATLSIHTLMASDMNRIFTLKVTNDMGERVYWSRLTVVRYPKDSVIMCAYAILLSLALIMILKVYCFCSLYRKRRKRRLDVRSKTDYETKPERSTILKYIYLHSSTFTTQHPQFAKIIYFFIGIVFSFGFCVLMLKN